MRLKTYQVEKPWGRTDIPTGFACGSDKRIGEIWFDGDVEKKLPLLAKWIFTSDRLSIQVHPNDEQARARGMPSGKEECWYIVDAEPDAVIAIGTKKPLSAEQLRAASLSGEIENLLDWKPVRSGDYFFIPAGTVHAIGAGITLVEMQQNSDITYRLYDYQRLDKGALRELHLDDGVAVSAPEIYDDPRCGHAAGNMLLGQSDYFSMWLAEDEGGLEKAGVGKRRWVLPIEGTARAGGEIAGPGQCLLAEPGEAVTMDAGCRLLIAAI